MQRSTTLLLIATCCLFASCRTPFLVPQDVSNADPDNRLMTAKSEEVAIYFEPLVMKPSHIIFDLEVINTSKDTLTYLPEDLYYMAYDPEGNLLQDEEVSLEKFPWNIHAYNYLEARMMLKQKIKGKKARKTFFDIASIGILTAIIASEDNEYDGEENIGNSIIKSVAYSGAFLVTEGGSNAMAFEIGDSYGELENLEYDYLFRTRIPPGERVRGLVYFPKRINGARYKFFVPLKEAVFEFEFYGSRREAGR